MSIVQAQIEQNYRHNFSTSVIGGSFFGLALGFASSVTVIPLFVSTLTDSTILIGLIGSIQLIGSQLPQLLMVARVAGMRRYKPLAVIMSIQERVPFLGLVALALLTPQLSAGTALALCYGLFIWHSLGMGLTATPYQSMISKIIPERKRGILIGAQMAGFSLLSSVGAIVAGNWMENIAYPNNYAACFGAATIAIAISYVFLILTREPAHELTTTPSRAIIPWSRLRQIWRENRNFRWFVLARMSGQFVLVALNFFSVSAIQRFAVTEQTLGLMTGLLFFSQIAASLFGGWMGDRAGHRLVLAIGAGLMSLSAATAAFAPHPNWLFAVFFLGGMGSAILITNITSMTMEFGQPAERPFYIGLANTITAFAALIAPFLSGAIVELSGYPAMFSLTAIAGFTMLVILLGFVIDPRHQRRVNPAAQPN